jgi:hypothetical protein
VRRDETPNAEIHCDVRVRFIVSKQHVITRHQAFNQIIFQQQSLGFVMGDGGLDFDDITHHHARARVNQIFVEIARNALF